ncbi:MAG: TonB C-terminal domain-containing protein [Alphaproteobacteria bacterium]|nr:TonB C-terminal domain-containing protein [Alphaproteobacteria bacterium]MBM3625217.1 TonB C-terminal domain-containing protein [Alphaproteobacteria bacterium]
MHKFLLTAVFVAFAASRFAQAQYLAPAPDASTSYDLRTLYGYTNWLALELRRHMPPSQSAGEARVEVAFKIAPSGRMRIVRITGGAPAHAEILRRALSGIHPPPPPKGRGLYLSQDFQFH